eukprot:CAMPEP_0113665172 /NCGR_PEP_ID=MMETSP0038_2-20120614/2153_1 /TAXON_ID=2898 /ORGANISM="Cryptomonas paramecium" /LENGTH=263 /DNA_ID=CAMNT_0000580487 /DNA_START=47 /DNA_END=834 /DNA_ORIENTATION=- /assembly_acc=CAM_ASM_000170
METFRDLMRDDRPVVVTFAEGEEILNALLANDETDLDTILGDVVEYRKKLGHLNLELSGNKEFEAEVRLVDKYLVKATQGLARQRRQSNARGAAPESGGGGWRSQQRTKQRRAAPQNIDADLCFGEDACSSIGSDSVQSGRETSRGRQDSANLAREPSRNRHDWDTVGRDLVRRKHDGATACPDPSRLRHDSVADILSSDPAHGDEGLVKTIARAVMRRDSSDLFRERFQCEAPKRRWRFNGGSGCLVAGLLSAGGALGRIVG